MPDILTWNNFSFYARANAIRGINDISIRASTETENGTADGENFVSRTAANPYEISFTALLNQLLGENVKYTATGLTEAARKSEKGYIYMAGAKLFTCQFMATNAEIDNLEIAPNGTWLSCTVKMTMKQCSKYNGAIVPSQTAASSSAGGGGGGGGGSAPAATTKSTSSKSTSSKSSSSGSSSSSSSTGYFTKLATQANAFATQLSANLQSAKTKSLYVQNKATATGPLKAATALIKTVSTVVKNTSSSFNSKSSSAAKIISVSTSKKTGNGGR